MDVIMNSLSIQYTTRNHILNKHADKFINGKKYVLQMNVPFHFHSLRNKGGIHFYYVLVAIIQKMCPKQHNVLYDVSFSQLPIFIVNAQINFHSLHTNTNKHTLQMCSVCSLVEPLNGMCSVWLAN